MRVTRRAQVALAHLHYFGEFNSRSFPLGNQDKYLGHVATEVRRLLVQTNATVAPYRLPDGTRGYVLVPFKPLLRNDAISPIMTDVERYYGRELKRLVAMGIDSK